MRKFKIKPIPCLTFLSFLGFSFFLTMTTLVLTFYADLEAYLKHNYDCQLEYMTVFIILSGGHAFVFFIITIQLFLAKPTSKKIIVPLVIAVSSSFLLLVAIDFFIEVHLLHMPPREIYKTDKKQPDNSKKKKGKGFKFGYFLIYSGMCIVAWFLYLAFKDLEEEIEKRKRENEPAEIIISHIT